MGGGFEAIQGISEPLPGVAVEEHLVRGQAPALRLAAGLVRSLAVAAPA